MAGDIDRYISACSICNEMKNRQQKEPLTMYDVPELPYQIVATDLFELNKEMYGVTVDSYSGYYDIDRLYSTTSKEVIRKLKNRFATHGSPETLVTDNASYYTSSEFAKFTKAWKINHVTISPTYSQSNGLAERAVQSAKLLLEKCSRDGSDVYLALLHIRNTPRGNLDSSAKRLMSRTTRNTLYTTKETLKPQVIAGVNEELTKVRMQKKNTTTAKKLPKLEDADVVRMQGKKRFDRLAKVLRLVNRPNSYVVEHKGKLFERNRRHLLAVNEAPPAKPQADPQPVVPQYYPAPQTTPYVQTTSPVPPLPTPNSVPVQLPQSTIPQRALPPSPEMLTPQPSTPKVPAPKPSTPQWVCFCDLVTGFL